MLKDSADPKPEHQLKSGIQISSPVSLWFFFFFFKYLAPERLSETSI